MLFNSTVYQVGGELKETTGELNPKATVRVPVTGAPVALVIVNDKYLLNLIGIYIGQLSSGVYLFNGKTSTNPSQDTPGIKVLFNGNSEMLINSTANTTLYYRYVELV